MSEFKTLSCSPRRFFFRTRTPPSFCERVANLGPCETKRVCHQREKELDACKQTRNIVSPSDMHKLHLYLQKLKEVYFTPQDWYSHSTQTTFTREDKVQELKQLLNDAIALSKHPFRKKIAPSDYKDMQQYLAIYKESDDLSDQTIQSLINALDIIREMEVKRLRNFLNHVRTKPQVGNWSYKEAACFLASELLDYGAYVKPLTFEELAKYYSFLNNVYSH